MKTGPRDMVQCGVECSQAGDTDVMTPDKQWLQCSMVQCGETQDKEINCES